MDQEISFDEYINMLKKDTLEKRAAVFGLVYGNKLGARANQWAIDQMLRIISGEAYTTLIRVYEAEYGPQSWDTGEAPPEFRREGE